MKINKQTLKRRTAWFIFWSWHLIYTVLVFGLIVPHIAWPLIQEVLENNVPAHYLLYAFIMVLLPFVSIYLGATHFRQSTRRLMKYFYGFEMPLLFFLIVRMMTFRDSNAGMSWLLINVMIALSAWFIFLWKQNKVDNNAIVAPSNPLAIIASTLLAMVGLYFGILFLILMIPTAVEFFTGLGHAITNIQLRDILQAIINPLLWLAIIFIIFTMSLFIALPVVIIYLYIGQFIQRLPTLLIPARAAIVLAVIGVNIAIFSYLNQQPQQAVFSLLEANLDKPEAEAKLLKQAKTIRAGLLNAYLARYRYVSTKGLSQRVKSNYAYTFHVDDSLAAIPQNIFNALATPFLYDGKDWSDVEKAQKLYESFFDAPIQKAERDTIVNAVKHNWEMSRDNEAGLLDAANHYVHLNRQAIQVTENHGVATISISQELENLTYQQKETVLHFRLPDDAVLSGLWLSDEPDQPHKYPYVLAPKGAAQAVYKAEVRRRIDPALLEQTGPYQYRLRVYPVPRKEEAGKPAKPLYVQFAYQTLIQTDKGEPGYWPLPRVLEKRNLFWDQHTQYHVNGQAIKNAEVSGMFPKALPKPSRNSFLAPLVYRENDKIIRVIPRHKSKEKLPNSGRFAILIDGSYSMESHKKALLDTLAQLSKSKATFDTYFCRTACIANKPDNTKKTKMQFFGNSQTIGQLLAFSQLPNANDYNAIFVLTDAGSYELAAKAKSEAITLSPPLWLVHLGDTLPYAYDDKVLDLIYQSKGGVTQSLKEALLRYAFTNKQLQTYNDADNTLLTLNDHHLWLQSSDPHDEQHIDNNPALSTLATAQHIKYLSRTMNTRQLENLDAIHALAKAKGIVTHYSSMLVLVNDRQRDALKKAEQGKDRFEREIETGKQSTTTPSDPFAVPSVPEPEEWALLLIAGILLSITLFRRRRLPENACAGEP